MLWYMEYLQMQNDLAHTLIIYDYNVQINLPFMNDFFCGLPESPPS